MVTPSTGSVVLVPFPFSDLSQSKLRPAVVLASADRDDWVLCQITSKPYGDGRAIQLSDQDFVSGGLRIASFVRPAKLFTAHQSLFAAEAGKLNDQAINRIIAGVYGSHSGEELTFLSSSEVKTCDSLAGVKK